MAADKLKLGVIGGGNMGRAIVAGAIRAGVLAPADVILAEIDEVRRREAAALGCRVVSNSHEAVLAQQLLLAVKPQSFADVADAIAPLSESKIAISIMAGLSSSRIRAALGPLVRVVRVMPNTPAQIGQGMTAIALGDGAAPGDERFAVQLFDALGRTAIVDESLMHAATAVSGSGPAYVFLLAEAMERAALALGVDEPTARLLVRQTILGAGSLLMDSDQDASDLRRAVTSPGGTTAAAIEVMQINKLVDVVVEAIRAARDRGAALDEWR